MFKLLRPFPHLWVCVQSLKKPSSHIKVRPQYATPTLSTALVYSPIPKKLEYSQVSIWVTKHPVLQSTFKDHIHHSESTA